MFSKCLDNKTEPTKFPGLVQAGSTQEIEVFDICAFNKTSGYFDPVTAATDAQYGLAVAAEKQSSTALERYMMFYALTPTDVFNYPLNAATASVGIGDGLVISAANSDAQTLAIDVDADVVATVYSRDQIPEAGTTISSKSGIQCIFLPKNSYWMMNMLQPNLLKTEAVTAARTLRLEDNGTHFHNLGAGAVTITGIAALPIGFHFWMINADADNFTYDAAGTETIIGKDATTSVTWLTTEIGNYTKFVKIAGTVWLAAANNGGEDADITVA